MADAISTMREALEAVLAEAQTGIDFYEKNGPAWTGKDGHEYEDASYVQGKMIAIELLVTSALSVCAQIDADRAAFTEAQSK